MISEKLRGNTARVLRDSVGRGITPRQAAMDLAQSRVLAAMAARGFRPDLDRELLGSSPARAGTGLTRTTGEEV